MKFNLKKMKSIVIKYLFRFLATNIFILLPLVWLLTGIIHDRLDFYICTSRPITLSVESSQNVGRTVAINGSSDFQRAKIYLPDDTDKDMINFGLGNGPTEFDLAEVAIISHLIVKWTLDIDSLTTDYNFNDSLCSVEKNHSGAHIILKSRDASLQLKPNLKAKWHFSISPDKRVLLLILAMEAVAILCCIIPLLLKRENVSLVTRIIFSSSVSLLVAVFYCLVVPLQSYLGNLDSFKFTLAQLIPELVINAMIAFVVINILTLLFERLFGRLLHVVLFGVVLYGYLEIGVLSVGLPPLNGDTIYYTNLSKGLFDLVIATASIGIPLLCYRWIKNYIHLMSVALIILASASIFDARSNPEPKAEDCLVKEFSPKSDVLANSFYSPTRNVFLFCLDSVTTEISSKIMRESPELLNKFQGFIAYANNVGMHGFTALGVPGFMTGEYYEDPSAAAEYTFSIFREKSFLCPYVKDDIPVFFNGGAYSFGFTNRREVKSRANKNNSTCCKWRPGVQLDWNLNEIVQFRLTPFILKQWVASMIVVGWDSSSNISDEEVCYSALSRRPVVQNEQMTMHVYHTDGCHVPFCVDRNGFNIGYARNDFDGACDKTYCVLKRLGCLFDTYREKGIYDNSIIVVCSDHGDCFTTKEIIDAKAGIPARNLAMLWVKPIGNTNCFSISNLPTSSSKIAELMKLSCRENLNTESINDILKTEKRLYRHEENGIFRDWIYDSSGNVSYRVVEPKVDLDKLPEIQIGKRYSLLFSECNTKLPLAYRGVSGASALSPMILSSCNEFMVLFKVDDQNVEYAVKIEFRSERSLENVQLRHDDKYIFLYGSNEAEGKKVYFVGLQDEVVISQLKPDQSGVVRIKGYRRNFTDRVYLTALTVMKD